jgi:GTP-binding protein HflX
VPYPIVALVGYTNAGKSTLFNRLTGADVMAKDMLFATLDPTMRRVDLPDGPEVILSDTVGFISDLPTELVAAFRATLEEVLSADVVVHVRDISHAETEAQARNVEDILTSLGVDEDRPRFELWNKIDQVDAENADALRTRAAREDTIFVTSAITGEGLDAPLAAIAETLRGSVSEEELRLSHADGRKRAWLYERDLVQDEEVEEDGVALRVRWNARQKAEFGRL